MAPRSPTRPTRTAAPPFLPSGFGVVAAAVTACCAPGERVVAAGAADEPRAGPGDVLRLDAEKSVEGEDGSDEPTELESANPPPAKSFEAPRSPRADEKL